MANIRVDLNYGIYDGIPVTFTAPCDCTAVTGLIVYYRNVSENTASTSSKVFVFKDAHGNDLTGLGNLFMTGNLVKVILDVTNGYAYIQNADTNGYLEEELSNKLPLTGGEITGTLVLSKTTEADPAADNGPALVVGGTRTGAHIEMDANEIIAKSNGTAMTTLALGEARIASEAMVDNVSVQRLRNIYAATGAATAGTTSLATGLIRLQYE